MKQPENNIYHYSLLELKLYSATLINFKKDFLLSKIYNYQKQNPKTVLKSNKGGWQSDNILKKNSEFFPLAKEIQDIFYQIFPNPGRVIEGMWINISSFTNYNHPHTHGTDTYPFTKYSGVFYIQLPKNSGSINFTNPLDLNYVYHIPPKEGDILFFPSIINHFVEPNLSQEDRISIAFNFN